MSLDEEFIKSFAIYLGELADQDWRIEKDVDDTSILIYNKNEVAGITLHSCVGWIECDNLTIKAKRFNNFSSRNPAKRQFDLVDPNSFDALISYLTWADDENRDSEGSREIFGKN